MESSFLLGGPEEAWGEEEGVLRRVKGVQRRVMTLQLSEIKAKGGGTEGLQWAVAMETGYKLNTIACLPICLF